MLVTENGNYVAVVAENPISIVTMGVTENHANLRR